MGGVACLGPIRLRMARLLVAHNGLDLARVTGENKKIAAGGRAAGNLSRLGPAIARR